MISEKVSLKTPFLKAIIDAGSRISDGRLFHAPARGAATANAVPAESEQRQNEIPAEYRCWLSDLCRQRCTVLEASVHKNTQTIVVCMLYVARLYSFRNLQPVTFTTQWGWVFLSTIAEKSGCCRTFCSHGTWICGFLHRSYTWFGSCHFWPGFYRIHVGRRISDIMLPLLCTSLVHITRNEGIGDTATARRRMAEFWWLGTTVRL